MIEHKPPPRPDSLLDPGNHERMILGFTVVNFWMYVVFILVLLGIVVAAFKDFLQ